MRVQALFKLTHTLTAIPQVQLLRERVLSVLKQAHQVPISTSPRDAAPDNGDAALSRRGVHGDMRPPNVLLQLHVPPEFRVGSSGASSSAAATVTAWKPSASATGGGSAGRSGSQGMEVSAAVDAGVAAAKSLDVSNLPVAFIDFDWAGLPGSVHYPPQLNRHVPWPQGVDPDAPIRQEHDHSLLEATCRIQPLALSDHSTSWEEDVELDI